MDMAVRSIKRIHRRILLTGVVVAVLVVAGGCNQQKPDPNIIETKLADGRVLHYTKQQLEEAQSWGISKAGYDTALSMGETHDAIIEDRKELYWYHDITPHPGTPPPDVTWRVILISCGGMVLTISGTGLWRTCSGASCWAL